MKGSRDREKKRAGSNVRPKKISDAGELRQSFAVDLRPRQDCKALIAQSERLLQAILEKLETGHTQ